MNQESFKRAASLKDLQVQKKILVVLDGHEIALFLREGSVYAVSNVCAHQHFSLLHKGEVNGLIVTCPMHGWSYDLSTGMAVNGNGRIQRYAVEIRGEDIFVEVVDESPGW